MLTKCEYKCENYVDNVNFCNFIIHKFSVIIHKYKSGYAQAQKGIRLSLSA